MNIYNLKRFKEFIIIYMFYHTNEMLNKFLNTDYKVEN